MDGPAPPPLDRRCGARTRDGDPCKNWGVSASSSGRCRMHGGSSLQGIASPAYVHGLHSDYLPWKVLDRMRREQEAAWARGWERGARIVAAAREAREAGRRRVTAFAADLAAWTDADFALLFDAAGADADAGWLMAVLGGGRP